MEGINKEKVKQAAERVYRYLTSGGSSEWGMDLQQWDWVPGVGVISILHYHDNCRS